MRRMILGSLGIALGVMGRPAFAQQFPGHPATQPDPVKRAARLGQPMALPDAEPTDSGVTPAGLLARGQYPQPGVPYPMPMGAPITGPVASYPLGSPRLVGGPPMVTEVRGGSNASLPAGPYAGPGVSVGSPMPVPDATSVVVPSITSGDPFVPSVCPEDPIYGGQPGVGAIHRIGGAGKWWFSGEYLLWWTRSSPLPTLAATGAPVVTVANGVALVTTPVPILTDSIGQTRHGGARFGTGFWFGDGQCRGVDARFLFLFRNGTSFDVNSNQFPVLGRPFFNPNTPAGPMSDIIGFPGIYAGGLSVQQENYMWGAEVNYRRNLFNGQCGWCGRLDGLAGFRFLNFNDQLTITETGFLTGAPPITGRAPIASATDMFRAENHFYGGQIGLAGQLQRGRWFIDGRATIAFGTVQQTGEIAGSQVQMFPGVGAAAVPGGLLALPGANMGSVTQNKFAVLPEVGINLGYQFTSRLRAHVGYDFLYLSSVLRPAGMIDTTVDAARIPNFLPNAVPVLPGTPRPAPLMRTTDFFAQGINFGLTWTW
jgi:hypothetical protein